MNHRIALCVGLAALSVAGATSAVAQNYVEPPGAAPPPPAEYGGMPPSEALMIARTSGLRPLTQPARQGPNWVLLASDNMGGQLRVMINARSGRIVHASPAYDPRFAYAPMRPRGYVPMPGGPQHAAIVPSYGAAPPPDLREPSPPLPRTATRATPPAPPSAARPPQHQNLASAPDITGAVPARPAQTPLPRPRPTMAASEGGAGAAAPTPPTQARQLVETSPEAEASSTPAPTPPSAAPEKQAPVETQMVPVAPLD